MAQQPQEHLILVGRVFGGDEWRLVLVESIYLAKIWNVCQKKHFAIDVLASLDDIAWLGKTYIAAREYVY